MSTLVRVVEVYKRDSQECILCKDMENALDVMCHIESDLHCWSNVYLDEEELALLNKHGFVSA